MYSIVELCAYCSMNKQFEEEYKTEKDLLAK